MLYDIITWFQKKRHKDQEVPYILDDNHYVIISHQWSNSYTYYCVSRYYINTVWGEREGGIALLRSKKELNNYIKDNKLHVPSEEELKRLMSIKEFRVRMGIDYGELEDTTLTAEEEKFLQT